MAINRSGNFPTAMLGFFVFVAFFGIIFAIAFYYGADFFESTLDSIDGISLGDIDFHDTYVQLMQPAFESFLNSVVDIALGLLFGLIIVMMVVSYLLRGSNKLLILVDLFLIILFFITAVYLSAQYEDFINSNSAFLSLASNQFSKPSLFILNLPAIVAIVGAILAFITYAPIKKKEPEVLVYE